MRKKLKLNAGFSFLIMILFITQGVFGRTKLNSSEDISAVQPNLGRIKYYSAPANIVLHNSGQNIAPDYITSYILVNTNSQLIEYVNSVASFLNVPSGNYAAYAINYNSTVQTASWAAGSALSSIAENSCLDLSEPLFISVSNAAACIQAIGGSEISALSSGNNTDPGFTTVYVLTDASGNILGSNQTGKFTAPNLNGEFRIYGVNYNDIVPDLQIGRNINDVDDETFCVDVSVPKCFNVAQASTSCVEVLVGAAMTATVSGNNTSAGFSTRFVLTNNSGVIQASNSSGTFTAPNSLGIFRIYAINYADVIPNLSNGINIQNVENFSQCIDVSGYKCFEVKPLVSNCEEILGGNTITVSISGNNTSAGFTTTFVLTNEAGRIEAQNSTGIFKAPNQTGIFKVYAVNFDGESPDLRNGININSVENSNSCVDVSLPKCFNITATAVTCEEALGGNEIVAIAQGNTIILGYTTVYVLVNTSDLIVANNQSGRFTAPNETGNFRIFAVNYSSEIPNLNAGVNINTVKNLESCIDVSVPKCFNVTQQIINCTEIAVGAQISVSTSGNNISTGYITEYLFTDHLGNILERKSTGNFTAPTTHGEYRVYAINYNDSFLEINIGQNISTLENPNSCIDVSAPKCFSVVDCPNVVIQVLAEGSTTICSGASTSLELKNCNGAISWFAENQNIGSGQIILVEPLSTTQYTAVCESENCTKTSDIFVLNVSEDVVPEITKANVNVSFNQQSASISATCSTGSYIWKKSGDLSATFPNTPQILVNLTPGLSAEYSVSCGAGTCFSEKKIVVSRCGNPNNKCLGVQARKL